MSRRDTKIVFTSLQMHKIMNGTLTLCPNYTRQNQSNITANQKSVWAEPLWKRTALATANQKRVWAEPLWKRTALTTANQKRVWAEPLWKRTALTTANQKRVWAEPLWKRTALATANQKRVWAEPLWSVGGASLETHCSRNEMSMFII